MAYFSHQDVNESICYLRGALVIDEFVMILLRALRALRDRTNFTAAAQCFEIDNFVTGCGGNSKHTNDALMYIQLVGWRRDFDSLLKKVKRPMKALRKANECMDWNQTDEQILSDGFDDFDTLEDIDLFTKTGDETKLGRISLFNHLIRMRLRNNERIRLSDQRKRLRAPDRNELEVFLRTIRPDDLLAPVPYRYSEIAGVSYSGTPRDFSFLTLALLARRDYKGFVEKSKFPTVKAIKQANALWTRCWDTSVDLEDRCSDIDDEWEGFYTEEDLIAKEEGEKRRRRKKKKEKKKEKKGEDE